jgi:AcrR family transcriptional regulator
METTLNTGEKRMVAKYKYMKHSTNQLTKILTAAEELFIKKGIQAVSFTEIASCCGITRSTLYRYFENKDEILWEIHHRKIGGYSSRLMEYYEQTNKTTYSRFQCFFHLLKHILCTAPHDLLFQSAFSHTYTRETMDMENGIYNHIFSPDEFRSGDMLRFLKGSLFHEDRTWIRTKSAPLRFIPASGRLPPWPKARTALLSVTIPMPLRWRMSLFPSF